MHRQLSIVCTWTEAGWCAPWHFRGQVTRKPGARGPPSLRKYPATRGGKGGEGGLWRSSGRIRPDSGTMGELSLISANNLPQERTQDGHLCHHYSNKNSHKKTYFKISSFVWIICSSRYFSNCLKKIVSLLDLTHQKIFGQLVEGFNERDWIILVRGFSFSMEIYLMQIRHICFLVFQNCQRFCVRCKWRGGKSGAWPVGGAFDVCIPSLQRPGWLGHMATLGQKWHFFSFV